jgi:hypothetical protein
MNMNININRKRLPYLNAKWKPFYSITHKTTVCRNICNTC